MLTIATLFTFLTILNILCVHGEIFTSTAEIKDAVIKIQNSEARQELIKLLENQTVRLKKLTSLVQKFSELSGNNAGHPNFSMLHPLNAYRFIRNHSIMFPQAVRELNQETDLILEEFENVDNITKEIPTVSMEDMRGAALGIIKLQNTYDLSVSDMSNGVLAGMKSSKLTASECMDIMVIAYMDKEKFYARQWLETALWRVRKGDKSTNMAQIYRKAAAANFHAEDKWEAISLASHLVALQPKNRYYRRQLRMYMSSLTAEDKSQDDIDRSRPEHNPLGMKHAGLCQGHRYPKAVDHKLSCRYYTNGGHPRLVLQPVKLEQRSYDPYIVIFHNVATEKEMEYYKRLAKPNLVRSKVLTRSGGKPEPYRTSKGTFLDRKYYPKLLSRVEAITSLNSEFYEQLQIANYGIGGQYYIHHDYFPKIYFDTDDFDNRIATFMIYLTDVEAGGATVFPDVGEVVFPQAGNALFWYNLFRNGTVNQHTMHAACPVMVGDKWVSNLWIRRNGQEFTKPCSLNRYDKKWE